MPIVKVKPIEEIIDVNSIPVVEKIITLDVKTNVVDTKYVPAQSLLAYIEGSTWKVNYYSQVIDAANDLRGQDPGQLGTYQQYKKIIGLEIKVNNPLSWVQSNDTKMFTVTGNAHVHSGLIANDGDMFEADVGDGRRGVFAVTLSEKKSILSDSVYYIEYSLIYYTDDNTSRFTDLNNKCVQTLYYLKDFVAKGQNPLIIPSEYEAIAKLKSLYFEMLSSYMQWFFSREFQTIMLPGQDYATYDHFVTHFMTKITDSVDHEKLKYIRRLNINDDDYLEQPQLFQALLKKDYTLFKISNKKMGLASVTNFASNPIFNGVRFSGVQFIVYPQLEFIPQTVDHLRNKIDTKVLSEITLRSVPTLSGSLNLLTDQPTITKGDKVIPKIKSVLEDDYYVFSSEFYELGTNTSLLEMLTLQYLRRESLNTADLFFVCENYTQFGGLERFYYIPILLALIKSTVSLY